MRDVRTNTQRKQPPIDAPYRPPVEEVEADITRFIRGHQHLEDVPLKEEELLQDIQSILDNELLTALNRLMRHWNWTQPSGVDQETLNEVFPAEELRLKLEELAKARMRDVLVVKLRPRTN